MLCAGELVGSKVWVDTFKTLGSVGREIKGEGRIAAVALNPAAHQLSAAVLAVVAMCDTGELVTVPVDQLSMQKESQ